MSLLLPEQPFELTPDASRSEPVVWVRRLVILESKQSIDAPIRDVTFRHGLNLIRTVEHPSDESRPVGHSVGKTLLTRLLRYCLGETHFATDQVRKRIAAKLPEGLVLAEFRVVGVDWTVCRPLHDAPLTHSHAQAGESCLELLEDSANKSTFTDFLQALEAATTSAVPSIDLPKVGHSIVWRDILGWLARDHECRYRLYNQWREPDAKSGTGQLSRDDASFLLRLVMGLVNDNELPLIIAHRRSRNQLDENKREQSRLQRFAEGLHIHLQQRLNLPGEALAQDQALAGGLFLTQAEEVASDKTSQLDRLAEEIEGESKLDDFYDLVMRLSNDLAVAEAEQTRLEGLREEASDELELKEQASAEEFYVQFPLRMDCPANECPLKPENRPADEPDPRRESELIDLRSVIERHDQAIDDLEQSITRLRPLFAKAKHEYQAEQTRLDQARRGIAREVGGWQSVVEQAKDYAKAIQNLDAAKQSHDQIEKAIRDSYSRLESSRQEHGARLRQLSDCYNWTVQELIGEGSGGRITLDGRGIHPEPREIVGANGAAMATLATVLGFDLACLAASIQGIGNHPRFVIHDSPKEADMEPFLYDRIFHFAENLESHCADNQPSFQYIVTTTSMPPDKFCQLPYTRLVLDGRTIDGLLLKTRY